MKTKPTFSLLFVLLFSGTSLFGQGDTLFNSFRHNDSLRQYILYVPEAYDGSEEWPLVVNIHGYSLSAPFQMDFSQMNAVADTAHFLVAYPQGLRMEMTLPGFPPTGPGFNLGADSVFTSPSNADDVGFIAAILDSIEANYQVAKDRIYSTGFSNGGILSNILACELGDRIAAVASVGGNLPFTWDCSPSRSVPILFIHGTGDEQTPYEEGSPNFLYSIPESLDFWTTNNNCEGQPMVTTMPDLDTIDNSTVEFLQWQDCDAEVVHFKVLNGGHQWPGGQNLLPFLGNFNMDINASVEIWNFFSRNPHPNPPGKVIEKSFIQDDSLRNYLLYVPAAYDGSEEWPLVVNIHGYSLSAPFQMDFSQMNAVADTAHFLVAYPQGLRMEMTLPGFPPSGPGFNLGADSVFTSPSNADDVGFIAAILDSIEANYQVAKDRIYSTGFSNGAMLSNILACELGDRIAAVASVGGKLPLSWDCSPSRPIPILFIHGTSDAQAEYEVRSPFLFTVPESLDFWTTNNNCEGEPVVTALPDLDTTDNSTVEFLQWQDCDAEVAHFKVLDGAHQWPGGQNLLPFLGNFNRDINASVEIWNFFNRHELSMSTGVENMIAEFEVQNIFPNPAHSYTQVRLTMLEEASVVITLQTITGEVVLQRTTGRLPLGYNELELNLANVPSGTYFLELRSTEQLNSSILMISKGD